MPKRFKDWMAQAKGDLEHARKSLEMQDYNWSCFASQQSAEKALKALYDFLGGDGWGHVIVKLLKALPRDKVSVKEGLLEKAVYLDKLYIPTRYPNGVDSGAPQDYYTAKEAKEAMRYAKDILSFVKTHLH
ncbi:MAG: HEPN domain-containing protein [Candidatus Omnitrophica bacterium]|nr:HEPN domain-containing protein [Candidatus Omnitrophota bacterium]